MAVRKTQNLTTASLRRAQRRAQLARDLVQKEHVLRFEPSTLSSGLESPFIIDFRRVETSTLGAIATELCADIAKRRWSFTHVAGVPHGGDALAALIARLCGTKLIRLTKDDGRMWVDDEFHFSVGDTVLVVEDVLTTGGNTLATIHALAVYWLKVVGVVAVCDREQGGRRACEERGYPIASYFTARELLAVACFTTIATEAQYREAITYLAQ